jgi:CheY-like chemotaxis protein
VALIAVVDDSSTIRRFVSILLAEHHTTIEFEDGSSALAQLPTSGAALVLLDIELPDMNGPEVLKRIREVPELRDVPVVAFTSHSEPADIEHFASLGFDSSIAKPVVDVNVLLDTIARHLDP